MTDPIKPATPDVRRRWIREGAEDGVPLWQLEALADRCSGLEHAAQLHANGVIERDKRIAELEAALRELRRRVFLLRERNVMAMTDRDDESITYAIGAAQDTLEVLSDD